MSDNSNEAPKAVCSISPRCEFLNVPATNLSIMGVGQALPRLPVTF